MGEEHAEEGLHLRQLLQYLLFLFKGGFLCIEQSFFGQQGVQVGDGAVQLDPGLGQLGLPVGRLLFQLPDGLIQLGLCLFKLGVGLLQRAVQVLHDLPV